MSRPAARITDPHVCPMVTGTVPHVGGPIMPPAAINVLTGSLPQARIGDKAVCNGPLDVIALGSFTVLVRGNPAARMGDITAHGGVIVMGMPNVLIGDAGSADPMSVASALLNLPLGFEGDGTAQTAMKNAMIAAAKDAMPFCEQCAKALEKMAN
ncbi:PAAR domain-containing protein [Novosphingobium sp. AAP83]|uniref:PAAR domain-containing protein n=1 Tax=Novosphingobium sp. AAP83 TaxID=1523425 RepID=UPI0009E9A83C|nr:PAAR domain-containing protein [Novosphingobium sp. AAP83]